MANVNSPHGFRPLMRSITGGPGQACVGAHKIAGVGTALFINDVVTLQGSGTKPNASIAPSAAGSAHYGVNLIYGAASVASDHLIIPGDKQLFEAQIDTVTMAQLEMNAALVAGAGSALLQVSGHTLGSVATTNTLGVKLLGLYQSPDNAVGAFARVICMFNRSQFADQSAGV
jgi:hypothetical protein